MNGLGEQASRERKGLVAKIDDSIWNSLDIIDRCVRREIALQISYELPEYEWHHDGCPYDNSGALRNVGIIDINKPVLDFLEMFDGGTIASYISGCGLFHTTYNDIVTDTLCYCVGYIQGCVTADAIVGDEVKNYTNDFTQHINREQKDYHAELHDAIYNDLDGETIVSQDYLMDERLPLREEKPTLLALYLEYEDFVKMVSESKTAFEAEHDAYVNALRTEMGGIKKLLTPPLGSRITREPKYNHFFENLCVHYTKRELGLLAYFNQYNFSNSLSEKLKSIIGIDVNRNRDELRRRYPYSNNAARRAFEVEFQNRCEQNIGGV